jgi:ribosomal-protein-alanine N-acetyltransferase
MKAASPTLDTERLRLRWLTEDDAELMLAIWNDPDFVRHVGDRGIRTPEQALEAMQKGVLQLYRDCGYGPYLMFSAGDGQALGICGLFKRDYLDNPDIGFALLPGSRRQGYVYEAAVAVVHHAREEMQLPRLSAIVSPGNTASIGLLEKLGMSREGPIQIPGEEEAILLYLMDLAKPASEGKPRTR